MNFLSQNFTVVWYDCNGNPSTAARFLVPGYTGYLPFFVWGNELAAIEKDDSIKLGEEHLLKGILYGLYDFFHEPKDWHRPQDKETLLHLLSTLADGYQFPSPEEMVLSVAYDVREKNGVEASRIMLETGNTLYPQSSQIKNDLICDLWMLATGTDADMKLLNEIDLLFPQIILDELHPGAKEVICYYALCSLLVQKKFQRVNSFVKNFIEPNIVTLSLRKRIEELLKQPDNLVLGELRIL